MPEHQTAVNQRSLACRRAATGSRPGEGFWRAAAPVAPERNPCHPAALPSRRGTWRQAPALAVPRDVAPCSTPLSVYKRGGNRGTNDLGLLGPEHPSQAPSPLSPGTPPGEPTAATDVALSQSNPRCPRLTVEQRERRKKEH